MHDIYIYREKCEPDRNCEKKKMEGDNWDLEEAFFHASPSSSSPLNNKKAFFSHSHTFLHLITPQCSLTVSEVELFIVKFVTHDASFNSRSKKQTNDDTFDPIFLCTHGIFTNIFIGTIGRYLSFFCGKKTLH